MAAICGNGHPTYKRGIKVGKSPFGLMSVAEIASRLTRQGRTRDLCLLLVGIDTALRSADMLALRVGDVRDTKGSIREIVKTHQRKLTRHAGQSARKVAIECQLTPRTQAALATWCEGKPDDARLFDLSCRQLRRLVKAWAAGAGLEAGEHAAHSLRKTIPAAIYAQSRDLESARIILGHTSLEHTSRYLGISRPTAFAQARKALGHAG